MAEFRVALHLMPNALAIKLRVPQATVSFIALLDRTP
jgi:hypothetical protein